MKPGEIKDLFLFVCMFCAQSCRFFLSFPQTWSRRGIAMIPLLFTASLKKGEGDHISCIKLKYWEASEYYIMEVSVVLNSSDNHPYFCIVVGCLAELDFELFKGFSSNGFIFIPQDDETDLLCAPKMKFCNFESGSLTTCLHGEVGCWVHFIYCFLMLMLESVWFYNLYFIAHIFLEAWQEVF